ncbi:MOSC domain-containing protein [Pseudohalocynthiibacter aestuariivivens]|uniref:MOSC domain-containing protein n=1 Tax=Pseudohalocynthiibacter aestuariivivens TaxID=1591409 RepID=A0ABV5JDG9_9RHOB|nr:MOSC domain-containing protein [Pseudohalocynthiibacter aestuariivivens]MBS9718536.1 MOSC domain-containing protein [Pseudohalocynthiibacter aestuariivivens]
MRVLAISVGKPRTIRYMGKDVPTAIYKKPIDGLCMVRRTNLDGDEQANLKAHGGPDKAVLASPVEHYSFFNDLYGQEPFEFGHFGENLTIEGLVENEVRIGDQLSIGQAVFEVTMPRMPCFKFGVKLGSSKALESCIATAKTGFYLRVLQEGSIEAGNTIERVKTDVTAPSVEEVHRLRFFDKRNVGEMQRALQNAALSGVLKNLFAERISELEAN